MTSQNPFWQSSFIENTTLGISKNRKEKKKLINDIQNLKALRANVNQSLAYYKIVRPFPKKSLVNDEKSFGNSQKVPDAVKIMNEELYRYSGIYCTKYDQDKEYRFEFNSSKNNSKKETYFVQILYEEGKGKLGLWAMPLLLEANDILSKCPIEDIRQVKSFVRLCKYYLDCQNSRKTQFEDLKAYIGEFNTCSIQANLEIYTNIQLQMFMLREIETDTFYDIVLYIVYEIGESRPNKLITDSLHKKTLPEDVIRKLKMFFENFKFLELKPAFVKTVVEKDGEFFDWRKYIKDKENEEIESDSFLQGEANEMRSLNEENEKGTQQSEEVKNQRLKKKEKNDQKDLKKMDINKKLDKTQSGVDKKVRKIRFKGINSQEEEKKETGEKTELEEANEEEEIQKGQIKKKIPRKVKAKVFKNLKKSRNQTKLDFLRNNVIVDQTEDLNSKIKGSQEEEKNIDIIDKEKNETQNPKNSRTSGPRKGSEITENREKLHEVQNEKKNSKGQNIKGSDEKEADKEKKFKEIGNKSIKKSFDLSNFILKRKKPMLPNNSTGLLKPISLEENIAKSSTPIPGRKQTHLQVENEISEIIKVNKPIRKSPEKRPRTDSSDSNLEEVVEEPDEILLKNLEEIQKKVLISSAGKDNQKNKKPAKWIRKRTKKARKL